ncbi:hypothetical protein [Aquitalea sp. USM4]|uniref:hypothetical protein n=1 Tax=Aquitalea sp. USM4 TaxID=1590041 RepID=UPI00103E0FDE|nr:hypothetical protein [Aquitalea sp. USM4]QBJ80516.1 hypothetical protein DKK66_19905 [Aquitalea sp. USM4]
MADISDVQSQLVAEIAAIVYPNGTSQPSIAAIPVKVYPGWPVANVLDADLAAGKVHISVYPLPTERKTTRHVGRSWIPITNPVHSVAMTVSGNTVTLSGTPAAQNLLLQVNGTDYIYTMQPGNSLTAAATALASLIPGASSAGAVIAIAGAYSIVARVGGFGAAIKETKRQEKEVQITIWSSSPSARAAIAGPIDSALSDSTTILFSDGSVGIIRYARTFQSDQSEKSGLYRRDLVYCIDYATTQTMQATEVIAPVVNIASATGLAIKTRNY